jgi:GT2 family glycosyltransferase
VSVVLTSCGRPDLLKRTVESFNRYNTFPIKEFIIIEDSGNKAMHREVKSLYPDYTLILNKENIGLIASIDKAYSYVKTPFVMHCEDDWESYRSGFIEKSLKILLSNPKIMLVWLRALNDVNGHPIEDKTFMIEDTSYRLMATHVEGKWHGFGFNPGLRRMEDYKKIGPYSLIAPTENTGMRECYVGQEYFKAGFRAVTLLEGYTYHIGGGRRTYTLS